MVTAEEAKSLSRNRSGYLVKQILGSIDLQIRKAATEGRCSIEVRTHSNPAVMEKVITAVKDAGFTVFINNQLEIFW